MVEKVAFIGLGVMGYPMAGHLARAGHPVRVFNRTLAKAGQWAQEYAGHAARSPMEAAEGADIVFTCVGNDDHLRQVVLGKSGAFEGMKPGAVLVDHTTASAKVARELHRAALTHGLGFIDAPVSGGQAGAEKGILTVMAGGEAVVYERVLPVLQCYARMVKLLGPAGSGQLAKMVNQICIAGTLQGLAEGLHFAGVAGLDPLQVVDVISKGAAQSWQMENRHKTMIEGQFNYGFAVDWMRKDLGIALDAARANGAHLPLTALVDQFYSEVQAMGGNRWDTSSLIARLEDRRPKGDDSND
jgi:3-hydroxyisobutyrate dehydrogenase-like beta-hydroxyacid dehydrogenase